MKLKHHVRRIAAALLAGLSINALAQEKTVPSAWTAYAGQVTAEISEVLRQDNETALRFRKDLWESGGSAQEETVALQVHVWLDARGKISRIEVPAFAHGGPNADLKTLLVGHPVGLAPSGMPQPLRVELQLQEDGPEENPAAAGSTGTEDAQGNSAETAPGETIWELRRKASKGVTSQSL